MPDAALISAVPSARVDDAPSSIDDRQASIAELTALLPGLRAGYRTTEFWINLAVILLAALGAYADKLPPWLAAAVAFATALYHHVGRNSAKDAHADRIADLIANVLELARPISDTGNRIPESSAMMSPSVPGAEVRSAGPMPDGRERSAECGMRSAGRGWGFQPQT